MSLLIYGTLTLLISFLAFRKRSKTWQLLLQALPLVFISSFLWSTRDNYQILHVKKLGYQFTKTTNDYRNPARAISIGGNATRDELLHPQLPENAILIRP